MIASLENDIAEKGYTIESILEDFPKEKLSGLMVATSVYVMQFMKEPFKEEWMDVTSETSRTLVEDEIPEIIESILESPSRVEAEEDQEEGSELLILKGEDGSVRKIEARYPFSEVLRAYVRDIKDPRSVVVIKSQEGDGAVSTIDLSSSSLEASNGIKPLGVARYRNISTDGPSIRDSLVEEISYYFDKEEDLREVLGSISEVHTVYLGEVANLSGGNFALESMEFVRRKFSNNLPGQVVYLTTPGTSVEKSLGDRNIVSVALRMVYGRDYEIKVSKFEKENSKLGKVLVYVYKPEKKQR